MKKRFIVLSSLITILLASFPFTIYADEVAQDSSTIHTLSDGVFLDQYFYDNYDLLPYIQSTGNEYLNTGVSGSNKLKINIVLSDLLRSGLNDFPTIFGSRSVSNSGYYYLSYYYTSNAYRFNFYESGYSYNFNLEPYSLYNILIDRNTVYFNGNQVYSNTLAEYDNNTPMYLFGLNSANSFVNNSNSIYKLYKFSIYDYSANDGEGAYVRYYYPAKAKTSGTIGLYDAINKTFISSLSGSQFSNPTDDKVLNFQISDFITSGLGWIDDIFDFVIATPIILFFFAVALAGSIYRWARRVVHF